MKIIFKTTPSNPAISAILSVLLLLLAGVVAKLGVFAQLLHAVS